MRLKKLIKVLPGYEIIKVWGNDEYKPLWEGLVRDIPYSLIDKKLIKGPDGIVLDIRYGCADCEDHIAVFVIE